MVEIVLTSNLVRAGKCRSSSVTNHGTYNLLVHRYRKQFVTSFICACIHITLRCFSMVWSEGKIGIKIDRLDVLSFSFPAAYAIEIANTIILLQHLLFYLTRR